METTIPTRASIVTLDFIRTIKENPNVNPVLRITPPLSPAPRTVQTAGVSDSIYSVLIKSSALIGCFSRGFSALLAILRLM